MRNVKKYKETLLHPLEKVALPNCIGYEYELPLGR